MSLQSIGLSRVPSAVLIAFLLFTLSVRAQTISGTISGSVVDQSGAVVPDARITAANELTNETRRDTTNAQGEFVFPALQPGSYTITVEKGGFEVVRKTGLQLQANQRLAVGNIPLTVGATSQSLTITSENAPVTTESASIAPELATAQLQNIPVVGRDVMALLRVLPGIGTIATGPGGEIKQNDPTGSGASNGGQYGSFTPNVGGFRLFWNTVMVDGQVGSNPDFPGLFMSAMSMDAVSEARIMSQNYLADYGRNPGPTIILVSKSGTSAFHGSLYYYVRNEDFNANDFFNNRDGLPKALYRFNTEGGTIGGPIFIPKLFNTQKNKLFFFYAEEDWQTKLPQTIQQLTVPTAIERQGNFSQSVDQAGNLRIITDPTTGAPFPGNIIPQNRLNPNGQRILNMMPLPNVTNAAINQNEYNYQWQDICDIPKRLQTLKLDYHPTDKDTISALPRRWWSDTRAYTCNTIGYGGNFPIFYNHYRYSTDSIVINWTHTLSPSMVNEFGTGFTGEKEEGLPEAIGGKTVSNYFDPILRSTIGFTTPQLYPGANEYGFMPQATFNNVPGITGQPNITADPRLPDNQGYERFHLTDNFTWVKGGHTTAFGLYFERNWATDGPHANCFNGCFDFTANPNNPLNTGWDFANAVLGNFNEYQESNTRLPYQARNKVFEWFAQDTWKINKKLTLTYGLRFSWATPWYVGKGTGAEFYQSAYNPSDVPAFYRPGLGPDGTEIAVNPTNGQTAPAAYIGAFTGPFNYSGMLLSSNPSVPRGFRDQSSVQYAPRFGFAYDPIGDGKTAIRGGFGVMKENTPTYNTFFWSMISNPPVQIEPQIFYGNMDNLLQQSGIVFPSSTSAIQNPYTIPSLFNFSLGVQRQIAQNMLLDVSYVGNVARHLIQAVDTNEVPYGSEFLPQNQDPVNGTPLPDNFFRPHPGYGSLLTIVNGGTSHYHSLRVAMNRRMANGIFFTLSYTWSKALGTGGNDGDQLATYQSWRVWNYGPPFFDQRQMFVGTWNWELPKASKLLPNPFVKAIFDNWQLSGVGTFSTGLPQPINLFTINNENISGGGDGARVVITGPVTLSHGDRSFNQWFNTSSIALPAVGTAGNASVYPFYGPGQCNIDATIMRRFPLGSEQRALEFRTEMYNAFNHTQFQAVDNNATFDPSTGKQVNATFGQVTATRAPRVIQFSLRLEF
jgi:Carboxypeptidase regulatory-like domain